MQDMEKAENWPRGAENWRKGLAGAVRNPKELLDLLRLPAALAPAAQASAERFPLVIPRGFLDRIRPGDPNDPLLKQILPHADELVDRPGFDSDPVGDLAAQSAPGLIHKYRNRALLIVTGSCAVNCRYCFRRHFPYEEGPVGLEAWEPALEKIAADPGIDEVILSGGDPLTRTDAWLARLADRLQAIGHLRRLRIHSRLPIVLPERVDAELLGWFATGRLQPIMVVHANHPNELDGRVESALGRLHDAGVLLLNQAVLLAGVNDDADTLVELCDRLIGMRTMPYYLHQLDRVAGAAHFEVPEARGRELIEELRRRLPGYAVPRYVRETAGEPGKTVLL